MPVIRIRSCKDEARPKTNSENKWISDHKKMFFDTCRVVSCMVVVVVTFVVVRAVVAVAG